MKIRLTPDEIKKIMDNFDSNHDDSIQFDEFLLVLSAYNPWYLVIWRTPNAKNGSLRFSKFLMKTATVSSKNMISS